MQVWLLVVGVLLAGVQAGLATPGSETESTRKMLSGLQGLTGLAIVGVSIYLLIEHRRDLQAGDLAMSFAQPFMFTVIVMAFTCASALQSAYESAFARMRLVDENNHHPWRANLALVWTLRFRLRKVAEFRAPWMWNLPKTTSWADAVKVAEAYKRTAPRSADI